MLTRLRVQGFKNMVDVEVRFGPLTCIAGPNGAGKSNLFDAIQLLGGLVDQPFVKAIRSIRGGEDPRSLFTSGCQGPMTFTAEMLIPEHGFDEFGQPSEASATLLRYELALALDRAENGLGDRIRLVSEELAYVPKGEAEEHLAFPHVQSWRDSVLRASHRRTSFIRTEGEVGPGVVIRLQSDRMRAETRAKRGGGKALGYPAAQLPRTVLSSAQNAVETRTAVLVREEMRNWRLLQLEPSSLRQPDDFQSPDRLSPSGAHLPATLARLESEPALGGSDKVRAGLANRLAELVEGVAELRVDRDEARRVLRFMMKDSLGLELPAASLSDGTLRFVALAVMQQDPRVSGVICLEEPENGIHPQRFGAMVELLYAIAVDPQGPVDPLNPLRQVIMSTHSPLVAGGVFRDDLVFAGRRNHRVGDSRLPGLTMTGISGTWRAPGPRDGVSIGTVLSYLNPAPHDHGRSDRGPAVRSWVDNEQIALFPGRKGARG